MDENSEQIQEPVEAPQPEVKPEVARRLPLWLAVVPALLVPVFFMFRAATQFTAVVGASGVDTAETFSRTGAEKTALACVETYSITPHTSESYVSTRGVTEKTRRPNAPKELSTVLRGMVRNACGEKLKTVTMKFSVHDDDGKVGSGYLSLENMENGEARPFEKVWIGWVTSWDIRSSR